MKKDAMKADLLKRLRESERGLRSCEIAEIYNLNVRTAEHLAQALKPHAVSLVFVPKERRWVDAAKEKALQAEINEQRRERDLEIKARRNRERRNAAPQPVQVGRAYSSVWELGT
jgi:hypothetical protein